MADYLMMQSLIYSAIAGIPHVLLCTMQIKIRQRQNILELCQAFLLLPVVVFIFQVGSSMAGAAEAIAKANDLNPAVAARGIASVILSFAVVLLLTVVLSVYFGVVARMVKNQK